MRRELSGRLSERVRIERRAEGVSDTAALKAQWECVAERWAQVTPVSRTSLSAVSGDSWLTARRWRVMMRGGVELSLQFRVMWRGRMLRIVGIDQDPAQADRVTVLAEEWGS